MKLNPFAKCFDYHGIYTGVSGSVIGAYDFSSGSGQSLVYNILYPSGKHFSGAGFYGPVFPLVNIGRGANGYVSGYGGYRLGYELSGDFGILIDFSFNNCARENITTPSILFSTTSGLPTGLSGSFYIGIDGVNQLYLHSSGVSKTLYHELKQRNLAFINYSDQSNVEFGIFDPISNEIISEAVTLQNSKLINTLYVGGILKYSSTGVGGETGLSGRLYNTILFRKPLGFTEGSGCLECMYVVDSGTGAPQVKRIDIPSITGYTFSGATEVYISGYIPITGQVSTFDNNILNILFPSGQTGIRQYAEIASILTGITTVYITGEPEWIFPKSSDYNSFVTFNVEFKLPLVSGDILEIYTYSGFNTNVNHDIKDGIFPVSPNFIQLIGNGLVETRDVDYTVQGNNVINGFYDDDSLRYDYLTGSSIISAYSGWWSRAKVPLSVGGYYPVAAQFNETIDSDRIILTGITGARIPSQSDAYLNGQKLISGIHYQYIDDSISGWFGGINGLNVVVLNPYFLPDFTGEFTYITPGGPVSEIISIEDSELAFLPNYKQYTRYYLESTGELYIYSGVTGFSEQIWVNGIRQRGEDDYVRNMPCVLTNGNITEPYLPLNFYNNQTGFFNI